MKTGKTILLTAAMTLSLTMVAQPKAMDAAIETFLASGQLMTKDTHWSHAMDQWHFKQTVEGDTLPEPAALTVLKSAFAASAPAAASVYFHDVADGPAPFRELHIARKDNFYAGIYGRIIMEADHNFRLMSFTVDGKPVYYGAKWRVVPIADRNGRPWRTLEGTLFRFTDGIWQLEKFLQESRKREASYALRPLSSSDQLKYETLLAQMQQLKEMTNSGKGLQADLRLYMLTKLFDNFDGQLTETQFNNILSQMPTFADNELTDQRQRMLSIAVANLHRHARVLPSGNITQSGTTALGVFSNPEQARVMNFSYDFGEAQPRRLQVSLSGTASGTVTITPRFPDCPPYEVLTYDGRFTFRETLLADQVYEVSDQQGNRLVLFADSLPTTVDLTTMTVKGSPLNERFAETQRRLKALEPELRKYAIRDADGDYTVMDAEGYDHLLKDARQLQLQLIDENVDNLIPVWYLANNFATMSRYELSHRLRGDFPYLTHIALQPVQNYYDGMEKRKENAKFTDAECVDTAGVSHRLSEYIGRGDYVVLQFWEEQTWEAHSGCKFMKQMAKEYRGKNLRLVGISLDTDKNRWRRYVKKRDLCYDHLAVPTDNESERWASDVVQAYGITALPETIIFGPDGRILRTGLAGDGLTEYVSTLPLK